MKKKRNFLLFFLMLVATMSALRYLSAGDQGNRKAVKLSASVPSPSQQRTGERVFNEVTASRRFCATETEPGKPLFGPLRAYVDAKRSIYVMDFGKVIFANTGTETAHTTTAWMNRSSTAATISWCSAPTDGPDRPAGSSARSRSASSSSATSRAKPWTFSRRAKATAAA